MSRRLKSMAAISIGSAVVAMTAITLALASIPAGKDRALAEPLHEEMTLPTPTTGQALFAGLSSCVTASEVAAELNAERDRLGGETMVLAAGLDQAFADAWRAEVDTAQVTISAVLAHAFADGAGEGLTVDVVEVDADGCAFSRTLMTGDDWNAILAAAAVPAV